jgi:hypothetical protein
MKKKYFFILAMTSLTFGCSEKDEELVDFDRIAKLLDEEEPTEWRPPQEVEMISGYLSPEEKKDDLENEALR